MARAPLPTWNLAPVVVGAAHLTLDEPRARPRRGSARAARLERVAAGRPVHPIERLGHELSV